MLVDDAVDLTPVRQSADVAVVDEIIHFQLTREVVTLVEVVVGVVGVDGVKRHAALATPLNRLIQQFPLTHRPQNELVVLSQEHAERLGGKRYLLANLRVFVFDDGSVEINCNLCHILLCCFLQSYELFLISDSSPA